MKNDREIRQLWDIAETYFRSAQELRDAYRNHLGQRSSRIAAFYKTKIPTDQYKAKLNILLAHLSSGAVRLATIDERFKEDHNYRITPPHEQELKTPQSKAQLKKALLT